MSVRSDADGGTPATRGAVTSPTLAPPAGGRPLPRVRPVLPFLLLVTLLAAWGGASVAVAHQSGLFREVGVDFSHYWAMWTAYRHGPPDAMYDLGVLARYRRQLLQSTSPHPHRRQKVTECGTPYPPIYPALFSRFSLGPPRRAFAFWSVLQLGFAFVLARGFAAALASDLRSLGFVLAFASYPVLVALYTGQVQLLTALCLAQCFLALRRGADLTAGLWLAAVALKPHYAVLILLLLLWKRRFAALAGAAAGLGALLFGSLLASGTTGLLGYTRILTGVENCAPYDTLRVIGWRRLLEWVAPDGPVQAQHGAAVLLALITVAAALWSAAGPWRPSSQRFAISFSLLTTAGLLASFWTSPYGVTVLLVPLGAVLAGKQPGIALWAAATALVPSASFLALALERPGGFMQGAAEAAGWTSVGLVFLFGSLLLAAYRARAEDEETDH